MSQCSIIMLSQHITVTLITYCCLLHHSSLSVYCSELFVCAVWLIVTAVQHIVDSCNVVNWILKIVLHLACHRQQFSVVIKCRHFTFVKKECDVAVSTVCLFVCYLCLTNSLSLQTLYRCRWKVNWFFVSLNYLLIVCFFTELTHKLSIVYIWTAILLKQHIYYTTSKYLKFQTITNPPFLK